MGDVARAAAVGDRRAIEQFVVAIGPAVLRVVRQVLGSHHPDTEDVAQAAVLASLNALPRFEARSSVIHFVRRVALLTAMNARRHLHVRRQITPEVVDPDQHAADEPSPMGSALAASRREALRRLLDDLPAGQAEVLGLHCVLGYTIEETAQASSVPVNTVRSRLIAAKATLRDRLAEDSDLCDLIRGAS